MFDGRNNCGVEVRGFEEHERQRLDLGRAVSGLGVMSLEAMGECMYYSLGKE